MSTINKAHAIGWPSPIVIEWDREKLRAAGLEPTIVPDMAYCILRVPQIKQRYGWSTTTLYRRINEGSFPKPISLGRPPSVELDHCPDVRPGDPVQHE